MKILIRGGEIIDPANKRSHEVLDLLLADGKVASIGRSLSVDDAKKIDASGFFVTPGLVDMHTHFREPGQTQKETIQSGAQAAWATIRGGAGDAHNDESDQLHVGLVIAAAVSNSAIVLLPVSGPPSI